MNCHRCNSSSTRVKSAKRQTNIGTKRTIICHECGYLFMTFEDAAAAEWYLGEVPRYTPAQRQTVIDGYLMTVKAFRRRELTDEQEQRVQTFLERVRMALNINRLPVGMRDVQQNGAAWRKR